MKRLYPQIRLASGCLALAMATGLGSIATAQEGMRTPNDFTNIFLNEIEATEYYEVATQPGVKGEIEIVRERYADGKVRIERQVTLNNDGNYVNHGVWKLFSQTGDVIAEGHYNFGERVGLWTRWLGRNDTKTFGEFPFNRFKAPFMSQANFANGKMDGDWVITDANDNKVMVISLKDGKRNGTTTTFLLNGKTYSQMTYNETVPVGDMLETNKNGELKRTGTFEDGRKVVTNTDYYPGSKRQMKSETMYLAAKSVEQSADEFWTAQFAKYGTEGKDLRHGTAKEWYANSQPKSDGFYQNGKKSGTFTFWHENGQVASTGEYRDDLADGTWVWWHANGQKSAVGKYTNGALIGDWRWWNEHGKLTKQQTYNGTESVTTKSESEERLDVSKAKTKSQR